MKVWITLNLFVAFITICKGDSPFQPREKSVPFIVYFLSRYRGICVGTLVSRTAVLTAAVCVTHPLTVTKDTRPINVIATTFYRHPRRGIRIQVTKIIIPKWVNVTSNRGYLMQSSPALMLLKQTVPDIVAEVPMRGITVDFENDSFTLHDECAMIGWHFFYKGDVIYQKKKFLLQRNMRVQFLNIAKKRLWCDPLSVRFHAALVNLGFIGYSDESTAICLRDAERTAQPCHGMYGSPLICHGAVVGMMMAPDAQWSNCTGFSNLIHIFKSNSLIPYMKCVQSLFVPEFVMDWETMKKSFYEDVKDEYDYVTELYDALLENSGSTEEK
ncbi:PREDICTED: uncharacterized protein LOC106126294 [Papilio xuthus]|uniref:Uncharacterized protein LOC106126294 n=1 Tax=Papilio xuthus TaxID=66420 RepID=A0AAJ6ZU90_PAPXU|nr:PREDICTED: uncharacterized protein LOC106126294 [Papilio xuthus]